MAATGFGLRPYRLLNSSGPNFMVNSAWQVAYNYASNIGQGDLVIPQNTGYMALASNSPSNPVLGVFAGVNYPNPANTLQPQGQRAWTAPTLASNVTVNAQIWDDQDIVFAVLASATSSLTQSCVGFNANFLSNGTPNATTGISTLILDSTSLSTNASLPLRIVEFQPTLNNGPTAGTTNLTTYNPAGTTNPILGVTLNTAFNGVPTGV
jgi:hypothetical protein